MIVRSIQIMVILACIPFLLGQDKCQINEAMIQSIQQLLGQKIQTPQGQKFVYVTNMSFMDAQTKMLLGSTEDAALINQAVIQGIRQAMQLDPKLKFNEPGHSIKNTDKNVNELVDIVYDPNKTPEERMKAIVAKFMDPSNVDVIVSGQYLDISAQDEIIVKPLAIVKESKKIVAKTLQFKKQEFICPDPANSNKKALCTGAHEEIAKAVEELLQSL